MTIHDTLTTIRERSAYGLSSDVREYVTGPDKLDSPGADMLTEARDAVVEALEWEGFADDPASAIDRVADSIGEIMDAVPSVYTWDIWRTFVDLGIFMNSPEDLDIYGVGGDDMTQTASAMLHRVCELLGYALLDELRGDLDAEDA